MKIKNGFTIILLSLFLIVITGSQAAAANPDPRPKALIEQTTYAFSPVIAGTEVTHLFYVLNTGDAPLNIPGVYSG